MAYNDQHSKTQKAFCSPLPVLTQNSPGQLGHLKNRCHHVQWVLLHTGDIHLTNRMEFHLLCTRIAALCMSAEPRAPAQKKWRGCGDLGEAGMLPLASVGSGSSTVSGTYQQQQQQQQQVQAMPQFRSRQAVDSSTSSTIGAFTPFPSAHRLTQCQEQPAAMQGSFANKPPRYAL
jgi:hypothetical protein